VNGTIEQFLNEIRLDGRSSPAGFHWHRFFEFLQTKKTESRGDPPVPLILAAAGESNARKHERLAQQLEWALRHSILEEAIRFLQQIPVDRWNRGPLSTWNTDTYNY
jgi:hypothetical protein